MKIKSIGTGGGFDYESSSFVITDRKQTIIFDAGYGVFKYLKENNLIDKIDYVFISHTHFDHIGNLEQIFFYRYFVLGKTTTVISGPEVIKKLQIIFEDVNCVYENGSIQPRKIVFFRNINSYDNSLEAIKGNHIVTPSYGLSIRNKVLISGDTKASSNIKKWMEQNPFSVVLHDYSDWNEPLENIHFTEFEYNKYLNIIEKIK